MFIKDAQTVVEEEGCSVGKFPIGQPTVIEQQWGWGSYCVVLLLIKVLSSTVDVQSRTDTTATLYGEISMTGCSS